MYFGQEDCDNTEGDTSIKENTDSDPPRRNQLN